MIIAFDTETTGLIKGIPYTDDRHPKIVQIAWVGLSDTGEILTKQQILIDPGIPIPPEASAVHGIDDKMVSAYGTHYKLATKAFLYAASKASILVAHNASYDLGMVKHEACRAGLIDSEAYKSFSSAKVVDTNNRHLLNMERPDGKKHPSIKLEHAYTQISKVPFEAHNALEDAIVCAKLFAHAVKIGKVDVGRILSEVAQRDDA